MTSLADLLVHKQIVSCSHIYIPESHSHFPFHLRLLEINGSDVSSKSRQEVGGFLQQCHGAVQLVVGRPLPPSGVLGAAESPSGMVIERFKKLNASLRTQLDSRSAEVDQWRQESERWRSASYRVLIPNFPTYPGG